MAVNIKQARKNVEKKIYDTFNILDKTGKNSEFYKQKFAKMSDKEFLDYFKQDFPIKFQMMTFEIDPSIEDIVKGLHFLKVPISERVSMPFLYENKNGEAVQSLPVLVVFLPLKRLKQMVQKKTGYSVDIAKRDYRTGLLIDTDKNANSTDREFESLVVLGLDKTLHELATYRADSMKAKNEFYNQINITGLVSEKDVPVDPVDSIARNLISAYLLGCHINSNLVNMDNYLPRTLKKRNTDTNGIHRQ